MVLGQVLHLNDASRPASGSVRAIELEHAACTTIHADRLFHSLILTDRGLCKLLSEKEDRLKLCWCGLEQFHDFLLSEGVDREPVI